MRGTLPALSTLQEHPNLRLIYVPLREAIVAGDVKKYDDTLLWAEKRLLARGTYLAVESAREVCLRRLLKKMCGDSTSMSTLKPGTDGSAHKSTAHRPTTSSTYRSSAPASGTAASTSMQTRSSASSPT
jgi:hypothetical protein